MFQFDPGNTGRVLESGAGDIMDYRLVWKEEFDGSISRSPALADIDGDGSVDIIFGTENGDMLYVLEGNGSLKWSYRGTGMTYSTPLVMDIDGDGGVDIVFVSGSIVVCLDRFGVEKWNYSIGSSTLNPPKPIDVEGDGNMGIVVSNAYGRKVFLLSNKGDLRWSYEVNGTIVSSVAVADINGDGREEVIVAASDSIYAIKTVSSHLGGIYPEYTHVPVLLWRFTGPEGTYFMAAPTIKDIDHDGNPEILAGSYWTGIFYCLDNAGNVKWSYLSGGNIYSTAAVGDLEGDGIFKIIFATGASSYSDINPQRSLICLKSNGHLFWKNERGELNNPLLADLNGDGRLEIIYPSIGDRADSERKGANFTIYSSSGEILWYYTQDIFHPRGASVSPFDEDGHMGIVLGCGDGTLLFFSNKPLTSADIETTDNSVITEAGQKTNIYFLLAACLLVAVALIWMGKRRKR